MRAHRLIGVVAAVTSVLLIAAPSALGAGKGGIKIGAPKPVPHSLTLFDLSCPSGHAVTHTVCVVPLQTDFNPYGLSLIRNGVPGPVHVVPPNGIHLDCPTTTTCVLGDRGGIGWVVNGQSAKVMPLSGMDVLNAVACMSATHCLAVGNSGDGAKQHAVVSVFSEGDSVAYSHAVPGVKNLEDVDCSGSARCVAIGEAAAAKGAQQGVAVAINGGKVRKPQRQSSLWTLGSISCGSPTSCYVVGNSLTNGALHPYVVPIVKGKFGKLVADRAGVVDLSCWNSADCLGVNIHAVVRLHGGHVVGTTHVRAPSPVQHVACPTSAGCLITGGNYGGKEQVAIVRP